MPADDIPPRPRKSPRHHRRSRLPVEFQPKRCGKAFTSLLLGILGCVLGYVAFYGLEYDPGSTEKVQIGENLDQMQNVLVEDTKTRGIKMFIASFGQWFGAIGALLGLIGITAGATHLYQAGERMVVPKPWLAGIGTLLSLIACYSIKPALLHGYAANVGLHVENTEEALDRVGQLAGIMQQGQDIANGKAPPAKGGLGETATGIAEGILGGSLNPIQQQYTEDYIGRIAPALDVYAVNTRRSTFELSTLRNTRVLIVFLNPASPVCGKVVEPLNALFDRTSRGQLWIIGSCPPKAQGALAFTKTYGAKFPVGNAQYYREPYSDITLPPAFMVVDKTGRIESFHFGIASLPAAISAAEGKP